MRLIGPISYRLDALTFAAIAAAALDAWTTYYFLAHNLGVEKNAVLALLAQHSLAWVPVFIMSRPLFIPFLPEVCRQTFAVFFLTVGLLFGLNNLGGIFAGSYFIVDIFSFASVIISGLFFGALTFVFQLVTNATGRSLPGSIAIVVAWIGVFISFDFAFRVLAQFLTSATT
jgi:hypothetical protein